MIKVVVMIIITIAKIRIAIIFEMLFECVILQINILSSIKYIICNCQNNLEMWNYCPISQMRTLRPSLVK